MKGKVYLIGAGPGDPEYLTLKALRILGTADAVLHDDLISRDVLALISPAARVHNVGKRCGKKGTSQEEIHGLLTTYARGGMRVVRLKGGDPLIFGRAGEEMEALRDSGIDFEVVPGVTAASSAAASARIPLTDRRLASKLIFVTHHRSAGKPPITWPELNLTDATLVVYMPGPNDQDLSDVLRAAGLKGQTPCMIVSRTGTPQEQIHRTTMQGLAQAPKLPPPAVLIIGEVAAAGGPAEAALDKEERVAVSPSFAVRGVDNR